MTVKPKTTKRRLARIPMLTSCPRVASTCRSGVRTSYLLIVAVLVLPVLQEPRPLALLLSHARTARLEFRLGGRKAAQAAAFGGVSDGDFHGTLRKTIADRRQTNSQRFNGARVRRGAALQKGFACLSPVNSLRTCAWWIEYYVCRRPDHLPQPENLCQPRPRS